MFFKSARRFVAIFIILLGILGFVYFHGYEYLNYQTLKNNHQHLQLWKDQHYILAVLAFMFAYTLIVALSVPGAAIMTLLGGFLFGVVGALYVVVSATAGATIIFLSIRTAFGKWLGAKGQGVIKKMQKGMQENAFNYLITLRLIPLFPFWTINIAAGLLDVPPSTFVLSTLIGIIPATFIFILIGNSLNYLFASNQEPDFNIIFEPYILLPLLALAFCALLPVIYKKFKGRY